MASCRINSIVKSANFGGNGIGKVGLGSIDGGEDGEHNSVGFVAISKIFVTQDQFFDGVASFDRVK